MELREKIVEILREVGLSDAYQGGEYDVVDRILAIPEIAEALTVRSNLRGDTELIAVGCDGKAIRYDPETRCWIEIPPLNMSEVSTGHPSSTD